MELIKDLLFPERLGRLSFFVRALVFNVVTIWGVLEIEPGIRSDAVEYSLASALMLVIVYGVFFIYRPRAHDCGMPAWTLVFALLPYVSGIYGGMLLLGPSKSSLFEDSVPDEIIPPSISTVAGATCSCCGDKLLLASDGIIDESEKVICNRCITSVAIAGQDVDDQAAGAVDSERR